MPIGPSNYDHDLQLFAPLELDLDNSLEDQYSGYFFEYNKLFWSYRGERVVVGNPDVVEFAEVIYRVNPQDELDVLNPPPGPHQIRNTLNDVPPKAGFAFGNRYDVGYQDNGHGWLIGILDGPELNQNEFYGFARVDTDGDGIGDGLPPFIDPDYTDGTDIGPGGGPIAGGDLRAFGFGSRADKLRCAGRFAGRLSRLFERFCRFADRHSRRSVSLRRKLWRSLPKMMIPRSNSSGLPTTSTETA